MRQKYSDGFAPPMKNNIKTGYGGKAMSLQYLLVSIGLSIASMVR